MRIQEQRHLQPISQVILILGVIPRLIVLIVLILHIVHTALGGKKGKSNAKEIIDSILARRILRWVSWTFVRCCAYGRSLFGGTWCAYSADFIS